MEAKHTPGPWEIDTSTRPAEVCTVHGLPPQGEEGQTYVYVRGALGYWDATPEENLANARLIAAAPDLLRALQAMNHMGGDERGGYCICPLKDGSAPNERHASVCADARAAIAKITGSAA
jgi:hypothetical protein